MAYLDVISLVQAKNYLRIDDTLTDDDAQITRMINAALAYIENQTRVYVYSRNKIYKLTDGAVRVYDYPITAIVDPVEADLDDIEEKTLYTTYCYGSDTSDLELTVGFVDPADVPAELVEVAYEIIDLMYYEHETGKKYTKDLTELSKEILQQHKRFVI